MKIVFAPGCFNDMDMSQEELDAFVKNIEQSVADGSFFEDSKPLTYEELVQEVGQEKADELWDSVGEEFDEKEYKNSLN